jgi:hypothetical protein
MEVYKDTLIKSYPTEIPVLYLNPWQAVSESTKTKTKAEAEAEAEPVELTMPYVTKQILWLPNDSTTMHVPHPAY